MSFLKRTAALWPYVLIVISLVGLAYTFWVPPVRFPTGKPHLLALVQYCRRLNPQDWSAAFKHCSDPFRESVFATLSVARLVHQAHR